VELGIVLLSQKEYDDSLEIFNEALVMREREAAKASVKDNKKVSLQIAKILNNIGCVYFEYGEMKDAKDTFEEALDIQRETLRQEGMASDNGHLAMASTMCNIGYVYLDRREWDEAISLLDEALQVN